MAVAVIVGAAVALTFVPAALAIFGRALLWPSCPRPGDERTHAEEEPRGRAGAWSASPPTIRLIVAIACLALLLAAASGLRKLELGNPIISGLPRLDRRRGRATTRRRTASARACSGRRCWCSKNRGSANASSELGALQLALERTARRLGSDRPGANQPPSTAYGVLVSDDGNAARYVLVLDGDPDGAEAHARPSRGLEDDLPAMLEAERARRGGKSGSPATPRSPPN